MEAVKIEPEECGGGATSTEVVRWESYLPRTVLRILLVEADYSTQQIIAALLRKCNYKVVAVSDGLRAWETIKEKHEKIDLILTEADLPSISGFALLTLVMEHEICKHIPVIMMSSQDSVNIVLKCMQKGAVDYLIKPLRKNELRNLWQHVWRRHTPSGGRAPQNLMGSQLKLEATSENNAASNRSNDYGGCMRKAKGSGEKGSDAQNSCTTPYMEAESICIRNMQDISQLKYGSASNLSNLDMKMLEDCDRLDTESAVHESETKDDSGTFGSDIVPLDEALNSIASRLREENDSAKTMVRDESIQAEICEEKANAASGTQSCHYEMVEPSCGVRDLLSAFDNWPNCNVGSSNSNDDSMKNFGLGLSLGSSDSADMQLTEERPALNHSDIAAFSRYNTGKALQPLFSTVPSTKLEDAINSHDGQENTVGGQTDQAVSSSQGSQLGLFPVADVIRSDNMTAGYSQFFPSLVLGQSILTPILSAKSVGQCTQSPFHSSEQGYNRSDKTTNKSIDQMLQEQNKLANVDLLRPSSPAACQSASSSVGNGTVENQISGGAYGSTCSSNDGNASLIVAGALATACNDRGRNVSEGYGVDSLRSSQREAALTKFRLKRKDRCFEKKVRYQSRKILAEKRPRVKGQFVQRARTDSPTANAVGS